MKKGEGAKSTGKECSGNYTEKIYME